MKKQNCLELGEVVDRRHWQFIDTLIPAPLGLGLAWRAWPAALSAAPAFSFSHVKSSFNI